MSSIPTEFRGVTAVTKANVYFEGKVVSHSLLFPDGNKKTLGLIYPGQFHFSTELAERMEIVAGQCRVTLDGQTNLNSYSAGQVFLVPAKSGFNQGVKRRDLDVPACFAPLLGWVLSLWSGRHLALAIDVRIPEP